MKNASKVINGILLFYLMCHFCYAVLMFTQSAMNGLIWLAIATVELGLVFIGKRKQKWILPFLAIILVFQSILSFGIIMAGKDTETENADIVLVLGYQLDENQMSDTLKMRLDEAYRYAVDNPESTLVLCGGITRENTVSEAEVMKEYLLKLGLDEKRIMLEDQSVDTIENIQNSLEYIGDKDKILVISSNYHVYRASLICKKAGLEVKTLGTSAPITLIMHQCLFEKLGILGLLLG